MRATWVSYVAATWAFVFASASFYWALGGRIGLETIGPGLAALANDPWFVAIGLWGAGIAKVAGGLLALALIHLPSRPCTAKAGRNDGRFLPVPGLGPDGA